MKRLLILTVISCVTVGKILKKYQSNEVVKAWKNN